MVKMLILSTFAVLLMTACQFSERQACKIYSEICQALTQNENVRVIVSLKDPIEESEIDQVLQGENIRLLKFFKVTNQLLVEIDKAALLTLNDSALISDITLDKFYPQ